MNVFHFSMLYRIKGMSLRGQIVESTNFDEPNSIQKAVVPISPIHVPLLEQAINILGYMKETGQSIRPKLNGRDSSLCLGQLMLWSSLKIDSAITKRKNYDESSYLGIFSYFYHLGIFVKKK